MGGAPKSAPAALRYSTQLTWRCARCAPLASSCQPSEAPPSPPPPSHVSRPVNSTNSGASAPPTPSASAASRTRSARVGCVRARVRARNTTRAHDMRQPHATHRARRAAAAAARARRAPAAAAARHARQGGSQAQAGSAMHATAQRTPWRTRSRAARPRQAATPRQLRRPWWQTGPEGVVQVLRGRTASVVVRGPS